MSTANPQTGSGSLSDRIHALSQKLSKQEAAISRSTTVMAVVGVMALALLTAYFYFGYGEIANDIWSQSPHFAPLGQAYEEAFADEKRVCLVKINSKEDVWPALKRFFSMHPELQEVS